MLQRLASISLLSIIFGMTGCKTLPDFHTANDPNKLYTIEGRITGYAAAEDVCQIAIPLYEKMFGNKIDACSVTAYNFQPKNHDNYVIYDLSIGWESEVEQDYFGDYPHNVYYDYLPGETLVGPNIDIIEEACGQISVWMIDDKKNNYTIIRSMLDNNGKIPFNSFLARCDDGK